MPMVRLVMTVGRRQQTYELFEMDLMGMVGASVIVIISPEIHAPEHRSYTPAGQLW